MKKHDLIKQNLISAARQLFIKFGFEKTTMNEIAEEARKGKSSLYYYFTSKEEIFQAVVEYEAEILKNNIIQALEDCQNAEEKLRTYVLTRFYGIKELGNLYNALRNDFLDNLDFIRQIRMKYDDLEKEKIQEIIEEGVSTGLFSIEDTDEITETIQMTLKAVELPLLLNYEAEVFTKKINSLLKVFFNGIKNK